MFTGCAVTNVDNRGGKMNNVKIKNTADAKVDVNYKSKPYLPSGKQTTVVKNKVTPWALYTPGAITAFAGLVMTCGYFSKDAYSDGVTMHGASRIFGATKEYDHKIGKYGLITLAGATIILIAGAAIDHFAQ